jgi:hypothetical protein
MRIGMIRGMAMCTWSMKNCDYARHGGHVLKAPTDFGIYSGNFFFRSLNKQIPKCASGSK